MISRHSVQMEGLGYNQKIVAIRIIITLSTFIPTIILVFYVVFCRTFFFVLFKFAIVLSVLFRFLASDYPLVSSSYAYDNLQKCLQKPYECRRGRMVVGFSTTCAISAYSHLSCELKSRSWRVYSIQHYVIKFVSDLRQVGGLLLVLRFSSPIQLTALIQMKYC